MGNSTEIRVVLQRRSLSQNIARVIFKLGQAIVFVCFLMLQEKCTRVCVAFDRGLRDTVCQRFRVVAVTTEQIISDTKQVQIGYSVYASTDADRVSEANKMLQYRPYFTIF